MDLDDFPIMAVFKAVRILMKDAIMLEDLLVLKVVRFLTKLTMTLPFSLAEYFVSSFQAFITNSCCELILERSNIEIFSLVFFISLTTL